MNQCIGCPLEFEQLIGTGVQSFSEFAMFSSFLLESDDGSLLLSLLGFSVLLSESFFGYTNQAKKENRRFSKTPDKAIARARLLRAVLLYTQQLPRRLQSNCQKRQVESNMTPNKIGPGMAPNALNRRD